MKVQDARTNITVGGIIRVLRRERGLTQAMLSRGGKADEICSERHLRRIESGDTEPAPFILYKLVKALGVSMTEFVLMLEEGETPPG